MDNYQNYMEIIVKEQYEVLKPSFTCCTCPVCEHDILTHALNHLPPMYFNSSPGKAHYKLRSLEKQHKADVISALLKAVETVSSSPNHAGSTPSASSPSP